MKHLERVVYNCIEFAEQNDFAIIGDINSDDVINIQDIVLVVSLVLNNEYIYQADLNSDSIVDILDIVQLVNIILS